jgi:hypothetical protein
MSRPGISLLLARPSHTEASMSPSLPPNLEQEAIAQRNSGLPKWGPRVRAAPSRRVGSFLKAGFGQVAHLPRERPSERMAHPNSM